MEHQKDNLNKIKQNNIVHHTLAHSYIVYFFILFFAISLDLFFPIKIFHNSITMFIGFVFLSIATLVILWAQKSSINLLKKEEVTKEHFCRGPYCYTRTPTHWGLLFLAIGFGFIINAFFVIVFSLIFFIIAKITFIKKQEKFLENKYGAPYLEYKKNIRF